MYTTVIGLEVHCELNTNSKVFSMSKNEYNPVPNTNLDIVDLGFPGILPVLNKEAVRKAIKLAYALKCDVSNEVLFDRKNYYYPDLPKGYQITQMEKPFGINGKVNIDTKSGEKTITIHDIHLEEDTASLQHEKTYSLIDYNRAGSPLIEIVTNPDFRSSEEVLEFLETLRSLLRYCDISQAESSKGQMRCDVNISLMEKDSTVLGTRAEIKNISSFSGVKETILYEVERQTQILQSGNKVKQETRRYSADDGKTYSMRDKVDAVDYKYYIEPNIPSITLSKEFLDDIKFSVPSLPFERKHKYITEYKLSYEEASTLVREKNISDYYEELIRLGASVKDACNWVCTRLLGYVNTNEIDFDKVYMTPKRLYDIIQMVDKKEISSLQAKELFALCLEKEEEPGDLASKMGLKQESDEDVINQLVKDVLSENASLVEEYKNGKTALLGYLVGQVLKASKGKFNPGLTADKVKEELSK